MPKRPIMADEQYLEMPFPTGGIDQSTGYGSQKGGTTPVGTNVRTFEPSTNRARGGQRSGIVKYLILRPGTTVLQELTVLVGVGYPAWGGVMQSSSSGRLVTLIAVTGGTVYIANAGDPLWSNTTNETTVTPPLVTTGVIRSAVNNQKLWFADGAHWCYYDAKTNKIKPWIASAGTLPGDNMTPKDFPRLICTWRGRTVLSGIINDPQNWFMSAVSDPTNFDYAPFNISPAQAVCGNASPLGLIGDVVTALIPYRDDTLILGGDHTIWQFSGDPMSGGQIDLISDAIGMAWGIPWCKGPDGTLYFVSNRTGIYAMQPGQGPPQRISQQIEQLLIPIDTGLNTIRLIWDDRFQGLHVFVTLTSAAASCNHFFWEQRAGAWWQDHFDNNNHNPLCCCVFDGNQANDRRPVIGSWDGYVRTIDPTALDDDGTPILSAVVIGPLLTKDMDDVLMKDIQAALGATSGQVSYAVFVGQTAEIALASNPVSMGTWHSGRNVNNYVRMAGHAVYVKITASNPWALEHIRARIAGQGKVRKRSTY